MSVPGKKPSKRFVIGIGLIVAFSLFSGYINIGLLFLFGLPLVPVLMGMVLVWFSPRPWKHRLGATLLIFPSFVGGLALLYWTLPRAEPERFLIPKNFRGTFVIIFVKGCSADSIPYERGRRIYRIPENGVLIHNGDRTFGKLDQRFYVSDEAGGHTEIPMFYVSSYEQERGSWRWKFASSELSEDTLGVFWGYWRYLGFTVSTFSDLAKQTNEEKEEKNAILGKLIKSEAERLNCVTH